MKDFSKATPRPWKSFYKGDGSVYILDSSGWSIAKTYSDSGENLDANIELIVTAVNNFDKMKDAIETQLQIIESLIGSKRIVNLDESIAYYKQLLESLK